MVSTSGENARIAGEGQITGGTYGAVKINGAGSIKGDVSCSTLRVNGAATTDGGVKADSIVVNGSASFGRDVQVARMAVNGDASIAEGVGVSELKVKGRLYVGGGMAAHDVDMKGELTVGTDCQADNFVAEGAFSIGGLLNAGVIDVNVYAMCKAREIGGEKVTVRQGRGITSIFTFFTDKRLTAESIEADEVVLEYTTAKVVRGARVELGEGCDVGLVEYTEDFKQAAGATVGSAVRVVASSDG